MFITREIGLDYDGDKCLDAMGSNPGTAPQLFESIRCLVPPGGFRCQFLAGVLDDSLGVRGDCSAGERRVRAWSKILF